MTMPASQLRSAAATSHHPGLTALLNPRAVAIVGASGRAGTMFARPLAFLRKYEFPGPIYPVNPNYGEIDGVRCYPTPSDVPDRPDLVLSLVPAAATIDLVRECGRCGVGAMIVFASGFGEAGETGRRLQRELKVAARESNVRILGPNCQGVIHVPHRLVATFTPAIDTSMPESQGIAYVGQSGAVGGSALELARAKRMGLTAWVSTGNQVDIDHVEIAASLLDEPDIFVIMLYLESLPDVRGYVDLARKARLLGKHLVVLRSGRSHAGRRAAESHTGAMLDPDAPFDLVSIAEGVCLVEDVDELLDTAYALRWAPLPTGRRVAVVTTSGGAGSLVTDQLVKHGLAVDELTPETEESLREVVPDFGATANPVDVTAQLVNRGEHAFADVCRTAALDANVDILVIVFTLITDDVGVRLATALGDLAPALNKPVLLSWLASEEKTSAGRDIFGRHRIPVLNSLAALARTAAALATRGEIGTHDVGTLPVVTSYPIDVEAARRRITSPLLLESAGFAFLDEIGVPRSASELVRSVAEAGRVARRFDRPVALKIYSPGVVHKSDVGGVLLNVEPDAVSVGYEQLIATATPRLGTRPDGVLVQPMARAGHEMIIGVTRADGFPPILTVGFGGIATELYRDVASRCLPVDADGVRVMLSELAGWPLLHGFRGTPDADVDALVEAVLRLAQASVALDEQLVEMEVNPLLVHEDGDGVTAVDFMLRTVDGEEPVDGS